MNFFLNSRVLSLTWKISETLVGSIPKGEEVMSMDLLRVVLVLLLSSYCFLLISKRREGSMVLGRW